MHYNISGNIFKLFIATLSIGLMGFGHVSLAQRNTSKAESVSQSVPSDANKRQKYRSPRSSSRDPEGRSTRVKKNTSRNSFIMNEPRDPLRPSDRARYYGIGSLEVGINAGVSHSFTDIAGKAGGQNADFKSMMVNNASYTGGVFTRYRISEYFGLALGFDYAKLQGKSADENGFLYYVGDEVGADGLFVLNELSERVPVTTTIHSFSGNMLEASAKFEIHAPFMQTTGFGLYGFVGFSGLYNKPKYFNETGSEMEIPWIIGTGYGQLYAGKTTPSPFSLALPFGIGLTTMVANYVRIGIEAGYRYTGNQGIDGLHVADAGYDAYMFSTFKIGYVFPARK